MSATSAYRGDLETHGGQFGERDGDWLLVASLLELAVLPNDDTERSDLLATVDAQIVRTMGDAEIAAAAEQEWGRESASAFERIYLFAVTIQEALAFGLADCIVTQASRFEGITTIDRGRLLAVRARISRKRDMLDFAEDQYRSVWRIGVRERSDELRARASLGLGAVTVAQGNFPAMVRHTRRAARLAASTGLRRVEHEARFGLMMYAAKHEKFDEALLQSWAMLRCAGTNPSHRAADLQAIGMLFVEMGDFVGAHKLFVAALQAPSEARVVLGALGGLAISSSQIGNLETLEWAFHEVDTLHRPNVPQYELTTALYDCAVAAAALGRAQDAERYARATSDIAARNGFHEFGIKAERIQVGSAIPHAVVQRIAPRAAAIVANVHDMKTAPLPRRAQLAGATSGW